MPSPVSPFRTALPAAAPSPRHERPPLDAALAPTLSEIAELKRRPARLQGHRSMADEGFRRAFAALMAHEDADQVAAREVAAAAAQIALAPVNGPQLIAAGLDPDDRRVLYARAAARSLGPLDDDFAASLADALDGLAPETPAFHAVDLLCSQPRGGALSEKAARIVRPPEEMQSEHAWCVAVIGALLQIRRGLSPGNAFLTGLAHHLPDAYALPARTEDSMPGAESQRAATRALARALDPCPAPLATAIEAAMLRRHDLADPGAEAFVAADLIDRVLQQRHYANAAGFSLSDAMDAREFVTAPELRDFQLDILARFRLTF
ncbi:hypothetical protein ATO13_04315 [Stappia sp. 22II-S9-Z10]|nr:hypothetical protein ATO13_04315 [Stappia sp. 22II-S9-Z10]